MEGVRWALNDSRLAGRRPSEVSLGSWARGPRDSFIPKLLVLGK
jgi:hypothetical protein